DRARHAARAGARRRVAHGARPAAQPAPPDGRAGGGVAAARRAALLRSRGRAAPPMIHLIPVGVAAALWYLLYRLNRATGWLRTGEVVFWDAILLIAVFLAWLRWF